MIGCRKTDPRIYAAGRNFLGLTSSECLFIDDDPALVAAAIELGHQGVTLFARSIGTATRDHDAH